MDALLKKRIKLLTNLALTMQTKNPPMSRIYRSKILDLMGDGAHGLNKDTTKFCNFCGNALNPTTVSVRFSPRMTLKPKTLRLLLRAQNSGKYLSKYQQNLLKLYRDSSTDLRLKCLLCQRVHKIRGPSRQSLLRDKLEEINNTEKDSEIKKTPLTKKEKQRLKKKNKRSEKRRRMNESFESISQGNSSHVTMETDSGLDTSLSCSSTMSPLVSSTPKPVLPTSVFESVDNTGNASWEFSQNMTSDSNQSRGPISCLWQQAKVEDNKSANEKLSLSASLLESVSKKTGKNTVTKSSKKKKKNKDMHLQLQQIFKKNQKSKESKGSLKDFLSSL